MTAFCDKRYYIDSIQPIPNGHKALRENATNHETAPDEECGVTDIGEKFDDGDETNPNVIFELSDEIIVLQD